MLRNNLLENVKKRSKLLIGLREDVLSRFTCSICQDLLVDSTQTECGCRFCAPCIISHFDGGSRICPNCEEEVARETLLKDRAMEREISKLKVGCINSGCNNICTIKVLDEHLQNCHYRLEQCSKCLESFPFKKSREHSENVCPSAIVQCVDCYREMPRREFQNAHRNIDNIQNLCSKWLASCPYKCDSKLQKDLATHLANCSFRPVECLMKSFGCDFIGKSRDLELHIGQHTIQHMKMTTEAFGRLKAENEQLKNLHAIENKSLTEDLRELRRENTELTNQMQAHNIAHTDMQTSFAEMKSEIDKYKSLLGIVSVSSTQSNEVTLISNGKCLWTITNIQEKIADARSGCHVQIISESFYLHRPGCRMQLKLYPNGDGSGKGCFLSIFFVIVRGEFDDVIDWPFRQKVTVTLESAGDTARQIAVHMRPDNNEQCYGRPKTMANIGAGQPQFVKLSDLLGDTCYVHGGSLKLMFSAEAPFVLEMAKKIK